MHWWDCSILGALDTIWIPYTPESKPYMEAAVSPYMDQEVTPEY